MKKLSLIWLAAILFFGCDNTVEFDLPFEGEKLVVNCYFAADSIWYINVLRSMKTFAEDTEDSTIYIANADLFVLDGETKHYLTYDEKYRTYTSIEKAEAGKKYTLSVSAPGYQSVTSTVTVPSAIPILDVTSTVIPNPQLPQQDIRTMDVVFNDPPGVENYYAITIYANKPSNEAVDDIEWWTPLEPTYYARGLINVEQYYHFKRTHSEYNLLFSDQLFDGKEYHFKLELDEYKTGTPNTEYYVYLKSISKEYYQYRITYNKQRVIIDDPFATHVQVFNNIENGYGIFAAYSQSVFVHQVQ
jgi:hypothetical protein